MTRTLVIENDPKDDLRRLGDWLTGGGLELEVLRPHAGDALPETLEGYAAFVVMGGAQDAYEAPDGTPGAPWFPALERLFRKAVKDRVPTLGVCLGAQILAQAMGGTVERAHNGPNIGARFVARRDAAERDALFAEIPLGPDALQWHFDEITELPLNATLLAASPRWPNQAFRVGDRAWGLQFHIECDVDMIRVWATNDAETLQELGTDAETVIAGCAAVMDDVRETWQPFAERFAKLAQGKSPGPLTLIDLPPR
ncbi:type 1 glutamine amidotransferase [Longispora urticae]|uniref:type 1 glutamine amidotransferase n=1 Tax=Longispora sp. NPDC051575 TaxID=3154943 RepID=UPI0034384F24